VPGLLFRAATGIVEDLVAGRGPEPWPDLDAIAALAERERLGVSTAAIADAARRRDVPVRRIGSTSMLRLGYGRGSRLVCAALTGQSSAVGVDIAADKMLAKQLLAAAGIPVPEGIVAASEQQAIMALDRLGPPGSALMPRPPWPSPRPARPTRAAAR
jgi:cyanophycin synthetase